MSLREKKMTKKKKEILRSAAHVVSIKGYNGATLEEIAAELLMTKSSLYYYFDSKEDLIFQCQILVFTEAIKSMKEIASENSSCTEKMKKVISEHLHFVFNENETFDQFMKPKLTFTGERLDQILEKRKIYVAIIDEIIEQGIENHEFSISSVKMGRMILLGATNWVKQWFSPERELNQDDITNFYADHLLKVFL